MNTYTRANRSPDWVSQSRIVRSDGKAVSQWSVQLMRWRTRHGGAERKGWVVFVNVGRVRFQAGSR